MEIKSLNQHASMGEMPDEILGAFTASPPQHCTTYFGWRSVNICRRSSIKKLWFSICAQYAQTGTILHPKTLVQMSSMVGAALRASSLAAI